MLRKLINRISEKVKNQHINHAKLWMKTFLSLRPYHEHKYIKVNETALFPIVDGWQYYRVTLKCNVCGNIIKTTVKKIYKEY